MMEIVVKIPDEIYEASQILDDKYEDTVQLPLEVIRNGIPLPKGHGDLIDRKELLKTPMNTANYPSNYVNIAQAIIEADGSDVTPEEQKSVNGCIKTINNPTEDYYKVESDKVRMMKNDKRNF